MKILLVHNFYGSEAPSGENAVVEAELVLLKKYGNEVQVFCRKSDEIRSSGIWGKIKGAFTTQWNWFEYFRMKEVLRLFNPDVVHIHNTFPLISPSILYAIKKRIPTIVTLHNYRLFCVAAIPNRDGKVCTLCIDQKSVSPALKYKCYRKSLPATLPIAANIALHRYLNTWNRYVSRFIVLAEFHKSQFVKAGLCESKIFLKPNFYAGNPCELDMSERQHDVIFVGRLSQEKGIFTLLNAWKLLADPTISLTIIGDGPLKEDLQAFCSEASLNNVMFSGRLSQEETEKYIARSKLLILPSECYEGFPMVIREAFAWGTPVAVSNLGALPEIVNEKMDGVVFEAGNAAAIARVISEVMNDPVLLASMSKNAKRKFLRLYTEEENYKMLLNAYNV